MDDGDQTTVETVHYNDSTTVEQAAQTTENVIVTVDRTVQEGTVVVMSISDEALVATDTLSVMVDGEAAVAAESYSDLQSAANGGETSAYLVQDASAEGESNVLVAVNHFSERQITVVGAESTTTSDETTATSADTETTSTDSETSENSGDEAAAEPTTSSSSAPGFGVSLAVLSLTGAALVARRRA
jgi:PGF-CTERM protein